MITDISRRLPSSLLLLIAVAMTACGGKDAVAPEEVDQQAFDDLREKIAEVIEDPQRQATITALADDLQSRLGDFRTAISDRRTELRILNADYDATKEQFMAYIEKYNAQIESSHESLMDSHLDLVKATTAEEWDKLTKADTKMMKNLINSIQSI